MKSYLVLILCLFLTPVLVAQSLQKEAQHPDIAGKLFHNPIKSKSRTQGSPYVQKMFAQANVEVINLKAFMRYNVYEDQFEFITPKNDTLILDKIEDFGKISFPGLNRKYELLAFTKDKKLEYGYLIKVFSEGSLVLFKKENIGYVEEKVAKTTLEMNMPAKYSKFDDSFFLKVGEQTVSEFPDGKKELIKLFPDKKAAIETFLKQNKIDFDLEQDLTKLVDFLTTP